jgi:hypothetical protein
MSTKMGKVSVGLYGWCFNESDIFNESGHFIPLSEMPLDTSRRMSRLTSIIGSPCDICWSIHGDKDLSLCEVARVVYGEPFEEVLLCFNHEKDFIYWFREEMGFEQSEKPEFKNMFYDWFSNSNGAPDSYTGIEHVSTDQSSLPSVSHLRSHMLKSENTFERVNLRELSDLT